MASTKQHVLVFGPTGAVGRAAAIEAHRCGAHVWLAMRDINKSIQGLGLESEGYTRIQADLSAPDSLSHAVQQSGAKTAFVYMIHSSPDCMLSSFQALKNAGITYIVILSSFSVRGNPRDESNLQDYITSVHAKTEIALEDSGVAYATIRPGHFDSNIFWMWTVQDIKRGAVDLLIPAYKFDYISPVDVGIVSGAILANPHLQTPDEEDGSSKAVYLCGPELLTQRDAVGILSRTLDHNIKVNDISKEQWFEKLNYLPRPMLESLAEVLHKSSAGDGWYPEDFYKKAVANLRKYKGSEPTTLVEWVKQNREAFA